MTGGLPLALGFVGHSAKISKLSAFVSAAEFGSPDGKHAMSCDRRGGMKAVIMPSH